SDKLVRDIQAALRVKGLDAGPVDGILGTATRNAIKAFQRDLGLPQSGEPSPELLMLITRKP
ncbi:MAG: peptidoglycan-binding domain-containing protein, partial [Gammaproteobacteria bacterium]